MDIYESTTKVKYQKIIVYCMILINYIESMIEILIVYKVIQYLCIKIFITLSCASEYKLLMPF